MLALRDDALRQVANAVDEADAVAAGRWLKVAQDLTAMAETQANSASIETPDQRRARHVTLIAEFTRRITAMGGEPT
jgi:hypothetical protein